DAKHMSAKGQKRASLSIQSPRRRGAISLSDRSGASAWIISLSEAEIHLRRILRHNDIRTHWSLDKDAQVFHPSQRTGIIAILSSPLRPDLGFRYTQVTALLTGTAYRSTPPTKCYFPALASTTIVPVMCGCKAQKYG